MKKEKVDLSTYPDALTTAQARECLGIGKTKLFELMRYGLIFSKRVGRIKLIPKVEIERYLNEVEEWVLHQLEELI